MERRAEPSVKLLRFQGRTCTQFIWLRVHRQQTTIIVKSCTVSVSVLMYILVIFLCPCQVESDPLQCPLYCCCHQLACLLCAGSSGFFDDDDDDDIVTGTVRPAQLDMAHTLKPSMDDRPITPMKNTMVYDREHSSLDFKDGTSVTVFIVVSLFVADCF